VDSEEWLEGEPRGPLIVALPAEASVLMSEVNAWLQEIDDSMPPPRPREPAPTLVPTPSPVLAPEPSPPASSDVRVFCVACGHRLKAGAAFCSYCGKPTG
jgi:hypothetical protein